MPGPLMNILITKAFEKALNVLPGVLSNTQKDKIIVTAQKELNNDPVYRNETNQEHPLQSRVVVGSTVGLIGAFFTSLGVVTAMFQTGNWDFTIAGPAIAAVLGSGYALYGRLTNGLKPLFSRKK